MVSRDEARTDTAAGDLLEPAWSLRWRAPELALLFAERAGAVAKLTGDGPDRLRAEATVVIASCRLGRRLEVVERAIGAVRSAERQSDTATAGMVRVELAGCARTAGVPLVGAAVLRPVLTTEIIRPSVRADALVQMVECLAPLVEPAVLDDALAEADRLYAEDRDIDSDSRVVYRALLRAVASAEQRRRGDARAAVDAAQEGADLLGSLNRASADNGAVGARVALRLVHGLLDLGRVDEAGTVAAAQLARPVRAPAALAIGWLGLAMAVRKHLAGGTPLPALALLRDAAELAERHRLSSLRAEALTTLSDAHERIGQLTDALDCLRTAQGVRLRRARAVYGARTKLVGAFGETTSPQEFVELLVDTTGRRSAGPRGSGRGAGREDAAALLGRFGLRRPLATPVTTPRLAPNTDVTMVLVDLTAAGLLEERLVSQVLDRVRRAAPTEAQVARVGGAEFAVLLPGTQAGHAERWVERLRGAIAEVDWSTVGPGIAVHVRVAVAQQTGRANEPVLAATAAAPVTTPIEPPTPAASPTMPTDVPAASPAAAAQSAAASAAMSAPSMPAAQPAMASAGVPVGVGADSLSLFDRPTVPRIPRSALVDQPPAPPVASAGAWLANPWSAEPAFGDAAEPLSTAERRQSSIGRLIAGHAAGQAHARATAQSPQHAKPAPQRTPSADNPSQQPQTPSAHQAPTSPADRPSVADLLGGSTAEAPAQDRQTESATAQPAQDQTTPASQTQPRNLAPEPPQMPPLTLPALPIPPPLEPEAPASSTSSVFRSHQPDPLMSADPSVRITAGEIAAAQEIEPPGEPEPEPVRPEPVAEDDPYRSPFANSPFTDPIGDPTEPSKPRHGADSGAGRSVLSSLGISGATTGGGRRRAKDEVEPEPESRAEPWTPSPQRYQPQPATQREPSQPPAPQPAAQQWPTPTQQPPSQPLSQPLNQPLSQPPNRPFGQPNTRRPARQPLPVQHSPLPSRPPVDVPPQPAPIDDETDVERTGPLVPADPESAPRQPAAQTPQQTSQQTPAAQAPPQSPQPIPQPIPQPEPPAISPSLTPPPAPPQESSATRTGGKRRRSVQLADLLTEALMAYQNAQDSNDARNNPLGADPSASLPGPTSLPTPLAGQVGLDPAVGDEPRYSGPARHRGDPQLGESRWLTTRWDPNDERP